MSRPEWAFIDSLIERATAFLTAGKFADLPMIQHLPIPTPEDHPDLDTFDADMAAIARLGRQLWSKARGSEFIELCEPSIYDQMITERGPFEADPHLHLAIDAAAFDYIADDIAAWKLVSR